MPEKIDFFIYKYLQLPFEVMFLLYLSNEEVWICSNIRAS